MQMVVECPVQQACGGCPQLHRPRADEHQHKQARVQQALAGHGVELDLPGMMAGVNRHHYRNRFRMRVDDGVPQLFNPAKAGGCLVVRPKVWEGITHLQAVAPGLRELFRHVDHLEVRVGDDDETLGLSWAAGSGVSGPFAWPGGDVSAELSDRLGTVWRVAMRGASSQPTLRYYPAETVAMDVPLDGFVQINSEANRLLVDTVRRLVSEVSDRVGTSADEGPVVRGTVLDLYAGAGNFTLPLAADGWSVTAVEQSSSAMATLASQRRVGRVRAVAGDVGVSLDQCDQADVVVCNPPRAGLQGGYRRVADVVRHRLMYVGCNPDRLAVDVARLADCGLRPVRAIAFDMFPGTDHVETVVVMDRLL